MHVVRDDAPWCPWNIEFIRRINGLASVDDVRRIVFDASYLVLGLGDVYLGAPVATPLDPRHRLVTTKYNPARTWTPENAVGIGGAYLCIYGMEGPGGYQFVGRTVQVWNRTAARASSRRASRGCCGSSTRSASTRSRPTSCCACARTSRRASSSCRSRTRRSASRDYRRFLADNARRHRGVPSQRSARRSSPSASAGRRSGRTSVAPRHAEPERARQRRGAAARHARRHQPGRGQPVEDAGRGRPAASERHAGRDRGSDEDRDPRAHAQRRHDPRAVRRTGQPGPAG